MTTLFTEDFSGGTNGAQLTTSNTAFTSFAIPADNTFSNSFAIPPSTLSARVHAASSAQPTMIYTFLSTQAVVYARFYLNIGTLPAATTAIVNYTNASSSIDGELQLTTTGTIRIRNSSLVAVATSSITLSTGSWVRIEWMLNHTTAQQQVKIWSTSPGSSGTPDYDSGVVTATSANGPENAVHFGINNATTADLYFGGVGISDSGFLGPIVITQSSTVTAAATAGASLSGLAGPTITAAASATATPVGTHTVLAASADSSLATASVVGALGQNVTATGTASSTLVDQITRSSAINIVAHAVAGVAPLLTHTGLLTADGHVRLTVSGVIGQRGSVTLRSGGSALQFLPAGFGLNPFGSDSFGGTLITALVWQYTSTGWQQLTVIKRWNDSTAALEDTFIYAY